MDELRPCPFCGGNARIRVIDDGIHYKKFLPSCTDRHCLGRNSNKYFCSETLAVNEWNRRSDNGN